MGPATLICARGTIVSTYTILDVAAWLQRNADPDDLITILYDSPPMPQAGAPSTLSTSVTPTDHPALHPTLVSTTILLPLAGSDADQLTEVSTHVCKQTAVFYIQQIGRLPIPWQDTATRATRETVLSILKRTTQRAASSAQWSRFPTFVEEEFSRLNQRFLSSTIDYATTLTRDALDSAARTHHNASPAEHRRALDYILSIRTSFSLIRSYAVSSPTPDSSLNSHLHALITECDALTQTLSGTITSLLYENALRQAMATSAQNERTAERERTVSRVVAALALPGFFLALLGTGVIPTNLGVFQFQSWTSTVCAVTVSLLFGVIAWWAFRRRDS